jgi:hypothetical protein
MRTYKPGGAGASTPQHATKETNHGDSTNGAENKQAQPFNGAGHPDDEAEHEPMKPGAFPLDALNDTMRAIAEEMANVHQIPIELPAMAAVGTMSGALGKSRQLIDAVNGKSSFGNVYIIAAAPKSTGKGAASGCVSPLTTASAEMSRAFRENDLPDLKVQKEICKREAESLYKQICKGDVSEDEKGMLTERLNENQRKMDAVDPQLNGLPTYWVSNTTSEAMAMQFARNNDSLFAFSPEAGETVRVMMGKYGNDNKGDFDLWLSGYSVEPCRTDRVLRGSLDIKPCLSALLFVQPSVLRELITNEEALERGLTARTLPFIVEPDLKEDDGVIRRIDPSTAERWDKLIRDVLLMRGNPGDTPKEPGRIVCSEGAREVFRAFHNESIRLRTGTYRDIEGELGRWRENAMRLSLGQCVADDLNTTRLSEAQAIRAVELTRWLSRSQLQIMSVGRMERRLKRVREVQSLLVDYGGRTSLRELARHGIKHEEAKQLAADFPGWLTYQKINTGGRPSETLSTVKVER